MSSVNVSSEGPLLIINEQTGSEPGEIEVTEQTTPTETQNDWVISIKDKLEQAGREDDQVISIEENVMNVKVCIYRVPDHMIVNDEDKKSYYPQTVSIGPYHHGKPHLAFMEVHKWRAVHKVLKRTEQGIDIYLKAMAELEEDARACYQGPIGLSSNEFLEILLLDGCFVLEFIRGNNGGFTELGYARSDPVFSRSCKMMLQIKLDMIMLENQLPLLVLDKLLELQHASSVQKLVAAKMAIYFFRRFLPRDKSLTKTDGSRYSNSDKDSNLHCLQVFRQSLLQSSAEPESSLSLKSRSGMREYSPEQIHCVKELTEATIKFRRRKTHPFWDIRFKNGYLEIPRLVINRGTRTLFSNIIAFEECHTNSGGDLSSYIIFMTDLMKSSEDVSYLCHHGIIKNNLENNSQVLDVLGNLNSKLPFHPSHHSYLLLLTFDIDDYYYRQNKYFKKWNAWKRTLKDKYFDSPWACLSFTAAVTLLLLTLFQSYFAAYAYYKSLLTN